MATIAVYGAGLLGSGFVENLLAKGERVVVWNRTPAKLAALVAKGAVAAADPAEAARGAERVHLAFARTLCSRRCLLTGSAGCARGAMAADDEAAACAAGGLNGRKRSEASPLRGGAAEPLRRRL